MRTVLTVLHEISGIYQLPNSEDVVLLSSEDRSVRVFLTTARTRYELHLRRLKALGTVQAQVFVGPGESRELAPYRQRFDEAFARVQLKQNDLRHGVLMVTEVSGEISDQVLDHLQDYGDFCARLKVFDPENLQTLAERATRIAFAGLALSLGESITDTLAWRGNIAIAYEPGSQRPTYSLAINASLSHTSRMQLTSEAATNAAEFASHISDADELETIVRLLSLSAKANTEPMTAFLAAWSALEIFVQEVFKSDCEPLAYDLISQSVPETALFVAKTREVMSNKYNIRDKFSLVACMLAGTEAVADIEIFKTIKKRRDDLAHAMKGDVRELPAERARALLRKYLKLHLERLRATK
ncbi:hypothetical protein GGD81_003197 [Rhodobium orientis]|uniref:Uncharacterized protein n=1 Tax=Rhodobium orientis TaxID=34017 RepID=A0A327JY35_9HYPH|nr:hypothetical protein [Rhodobium orientis]MBB4304141.1 hypothetical protein [Rhodobium orientis]MBK5950612.1 hypothetical protein [Rhodobium orientis]RAI27998.1 hypothetical protein CH339_07790 [Rhodobium orientis]